MDPLSAFPETFTAGTTVKVRRLRSEFLASEGWTLLVILAGNLVINTAGAANDDSFDYVFSAAATAPLSPGVYRWTERYSKAGESYDRSGFVTVHRNLAAAGPGDALSFAEKNLAVVEAALNNTLESGMDSYQIAGRSVSKIPIDELMKLRSRLVEEVSQLRSGGQVRRHVVAFRTPGMA